MMMGFVDTIFFLDLFSKALLTFYIFPSSNQQHPFRTQTSKIRYFIFLHPKKMTNDKNSTPLPGFTNTEASTR